MKSFYLLLIACFFPAIIWAQGTIRGKVTDAETGEDLIGVTVVIDGTTQGTITDIEGKYTIPNLDAGTYTIQVSYIGYETKKVGSIAVTDGEITLQDVTLGEDVGELEVVVVTAEAETEAEAALITVQKKSPVVQDGISAEFLAKTGDRSAAGAVRRITGVSIEGGKYVNVRGLGDRYTKTTLNGADIPGLDPSKNAVQLDLFPSNIIENIIVRKTFSPDVAGNFTGGYVDIKTKDFPDRLTFQASASYSYNNQATFNDDFSTYEGGNTDYLAIEDGTRDLPVSRDLRNGVTVDRNLFDNRATLQSKSPFLNQRYSVSFGNQYEVGNGYLGVLGALSYQRNFNFYEDGEVGRYKFVDSALLPNVVYNDTQSDDNVLWGGLINLSYKLDRTKLSFNALYNRSGQNSTRILRGTNFDDDPANTTYSMTFSYTERSVNTYQLLGEHSLGSNNIRIDWLTSFSISTQDEPDFRLWNYELQPDNDIEIDAISTPARYWRDLRQTNWDNKLNLTIPFNIAGRESKFKTGVAFVTKNRDFNQFFYVFESGTDQPGNLAGAELYDFGSYIDNPSTRIRNNTNNIAPNNSDTYTATENIFGFYLMADLRLSEKLRALVGARYERTDIEVESSENASLEADDILPAINLTYSITEDMNLRFAYGRTLARPVFRELAPFANQIFLRSEVYVGNPNLDRTLIDNFDLRWEMYPNPGELVTVSLFYKGFTDPISKAYSAVTANPQITWVNQGDAQVYGVELEARKNLGFITTALADFQLGFNVAFIQSEISLTDEEKVNILGNDPQQLTELAQDGTRPLTGQSPYLVNAYLNYDNYNIGLSANVNFNVFGERVFFIGRNGVPDVYEQPRPMLDLKVAKDIGERWKVTFRARNILNPDFEFIHTVQGNESNFGLYNRGTSFSLGLKYEID